MISSMLFSAALFILVGLGLGHLLWYRNRSDDATRIAHLETRNRQMRAVVRGRTRKHNEILSDWKNARADWETLNNENTNLKRTSQQLQKKADDAHSLHTKLMQDVSQAQSEAQRESQQRKDLSGKLLILTKERDAANSEAADLRDQIAPLRSELTQLQSTSKQLRATVDASEKSLHDLQSSRDAIQSAHDKLNGENARLQDIIDQLKREGSSSEASIRASFESQIKELQQKLDHQISLRNDEHQHAQAELSATQTRLGNEHQSAIDGLNAQWEAKIKELKGQYDGELANAHGETQRALRDTSAEFHQQIEKLKAQLRDDEKQHSAKIDAANATIKRLSEQCKLLQSQVDNNHGNSTELNARINQLNAQLAEALTHRDDLQQQLEDASVIGEKYEQVLAEAKHLVTQRDNALMKTKEIEQHLANVDTQLSQRDETITRLQSSLSQVTSTVNGRDEAIAKLKNELAQAHQEHQGIESKLTDVSRAYEQLKIELSSRNESLEAMTSKASRVGQLEKQRDEVTLKLNSASETITSLQAALNERSASVRSSEEKLAAAKAEGAKLRGSAEQLQIQVQKLSKDLESLDRLRIRVNELEMSLDKSNSRASTLDATIHRLQAENRSLSDQMTKYEELKKLQAKTHHELTASVEEHLQTARKLEEQSRFSKHLKSEIAELSNLRPQLESLRRKLEDTSNKLRDMTHDYNASLDTNAEAEKRIMDLQSRLSDSADTIRKLRRSGTEIDVIPMERSSDAA